MSQSTLCDREYWLAVEKAVTIYDLKARKVWPWNEEVVVMADKRVTEAEGD